MRRRAIGQILLLTAGFLVLVAISTASVLLVNKARQDNALVLHTLEVENSINALMLEIRRAESAARAYLLTRWPEFLSDHEAAVANVIPDIEKLAKLTSDNPVQAENIRKMRAAIETRLDQFAREMNFIKQKEPENAAALVREAAAANTNGTIRDASAAMQIEENRLFAIRTANADQTQILASSVTIAGSCLVIALAGVSIFLVRRSSRARDEAEAKLRDNYLSLEATVDERTADLREANDEIQRFAYIVSHDLRSPLVNIMGFTSELEQLRGDIFRRIAGLSRQASLAPALPDDATDTAEPALEGSDKQLSDDFSESLGFIKSSIAKMDRLISAILNLTREGRRDFKAETNRRPRADRGRGRDGGASGRRSRGRDPDRTAAEHRQRPPGAGADLLQSDRQRAQISEGRRPRRHFGAGAHQAWLCNLRNYRQRPRHRSQGSSAHFRSIPPCGNPGQARTGNWTGACAHAGAPSWWNHVGGIGTSQRQHIHDNTSDQMVGQQPGPRYMSNPVTIIMIEDDEGHARLIERNIRRSGVNNEIVPFTNGTAAVNYLFGSDGTGAVQKGNALLILLDLNLPDTTGIDILRRVKENKYLKSTPVVILTTTDDSQEIKRCYELGCNVYITKPVNYESFANAIRQLGLFFSVIQVPPTAA